ncbi:dihydrofolate reductase family protein [Streptomyces niveus]
MAFRRRRGLPAKGKRSQRTWHGQAGSGQLRIARRRHSVGALGRRGPGLRLQPWRMGDAVRRSRGGEVHKRLHGGGRSAAPRPQNLRDLRGNLAVRRQRRSGRRGDERHALIDEYRLLVFPLLLGGGKRLFTDDATRRPLTLVSTTTSMTGVSITTYRRADG